MRQRTSRIVCLGIASAALGVAFGQQVFSDPARKVNKVDADQRVKEEALAKEGQLLFKQECQTCHSTGSTGGCLGPVLAGEKARRTRAFVESRISDAPAQVELFQRLYGHAELMPHPRVSPADAEKLTAFILSVPAPPGGFTVRPHAKLTTPVKINPSEMSSQDAILRGKKLVYNKGCLSCHSMGGMGGQLAPAFDAIGGRKTSIEISEQIGKAELMIGPEPEYGERGIVMPPSDLSEKEIGDIVAYLSSLK